LIVGTEASARLIQHTLQTEAPDEYEIVGVPMGDLQAETINIFQIDEIILAYNSEIPGAVFAGLMACYEQGIPLVPMPILYEQLTGRVPIEHVGSGDWAVILPLSSERLTQRLYLAAKRLLDIVLAFIGLAGFTLVLPFVALLMQIDSRGAIFYAQERLGRGGRPFRLIKLRTMIPDAEKGTGPVWTQHGDPRITRLGGWLRKTRLDEFPQLVNVLRGEMSIVGPRPERPHFVDLLTQQIPFYRTRLAVKPGLTGWAQVCYRYGNSVDDALIKLQYDLYYIRHQSLWLDVVIILRTVGKMITLSGT
jgi:exopolysaccharide biosynthesis polyprenyl glycosylphosphotransferase